MLFGPEQWPSYQANTRRWPLYRSFGLWRQLLGKQSNRRQDPFASVSPRQQALDTHNSLKAANARARREQLLQLARPLWARAQEPEPTRRRGRPACKQRLQALLASQGVDVTRRQLDELVAALKGESGVSP
jgi:hypothetical protein